MKSMIHELKNLITEKMSKSILTAILFGMICFQSCTKENLVTPKVGNLTTENDEFASRKLIDKQIRNSVTTTTIIEPIAIIKCGTEIPTKVYPENPKEVEPSTKPGEPTPPIYIPKQIETK
jgi:hypothetical protein